jgi:hypothetical protein
MELKVDADEVIEADEAYHARGIHYMELKAVKGNGVMAGWGTNPLHGVESRARG